MGNKHCVIMFLKSPDVGAVKSRLAATVQADVALELYRCFVSDMMGMIAEGGYSLTIFFYPPESEEKIARWLGQEHTFFPQSGDDLGERMKNAFRTVFSQGVASAILIGTDIPDLPARIIDEALTSLTGHDAVLGPTYDGGYYLIGFRADTFLPQAFDGISWSSPEVFAQTLCALETAGCRVHVLQRWRDIDTFEDLEALFRDSQSTPFTGSATIGYMRRTMCGPLSGDNPEPARIRPGPHDVNNFRGESDMVNEFENTISSQPGDKGLFGETIETLQINLGLACNQQCLHCHLECSPQRKETMEWPVMELILGAVETSRCRFADLTGGAPELNPHFRRFVMSLRERGCHVKVRTNLTVLLEPGMEDLPGFFKEHGVELIASLPCYTKENVCAQRGPGVYEKSIEAIRRLNALGYGLQPSLPLSLVYNPGGAFLPPPQLSLETDYRRELAERFGISFTHLLTITNMPLGRFRKELAAQKQLESYRDLLRQSFNPATVSGLMCRRQVNIGWDGTLYDCDFNLALHLPVNHGAPDNIGAFVPDALRARRIVTGQHCFGCTAGAGSSCAGSIISGKDDVAG
jgi:rSAM/selenodomain-associated transferase 1